MIWNLSMSRLKILWKVWNRWLDFIYFTLQGEGLPLSVLGPDLLSLWCLESQEEVWGLGMPPVYGKKKHPVSYVIKANLIGHKKLQRCATKVLTCKQDMCVGWGDQYSWDIYWGGQLLQQAVGWLRPGSQSPSLQQLTIMWVIRMTIPVTNFCLYSWSFSHCYSTEIQYVATICTDLCNLINCYYFENMFPEVKCDFR